PTPPAFVGADEPDEAYAQHAALRRRALIHMQAWRPAVLHRFALLLDSMHGARGYGKVDPKTPTWLLALIKEVSCLTLDDTPVNEPVQRFYSVPCLEELLAVAGEPSEGILHLLYGPETYDYLPTRSLRGVDRGADYLAAHAGLVAATLPHLHVDGRERLMHDLRRLQLGTGAYFDIVFASAVGPSKTVRKAACAILQDAAA